VGSPSKRKRGAQPGNQNALKHGLYTQPHPLPGIEPASDSSSPLSYAGLEPPLAELDRSLANSLQAEIDLIRAAMRHVRDLGEPHTFSEALDFLRALSLAATALSRLIRTQHYLASSLPQIDPILHLANQALRELQGDDYGLD
jgi:hypothetical protein